MNKATLETTSYRFRGEWKLIYPTEEDHPGSQDVIAGEGAWVAPSKFRFTGRFTRDDQADEYEELIFDGATFYFKDSSEDAWKAEPEWGDSIHALAALPLLNLPNLGQVIDVMLQMTEGEKLPSESIDGIETIHVKGKFPTKFYEGLASSQQGEIEVWLGREDKLIRRARYHIPLVPALEAFSPTALERAADVYYSHYNNVELIDPPI